MEDIEAIAKNDPKTKDMINSIQSLPDLTEEEVEEQILEWDKAMIPGKGFNTWKEEEIKTYKKLGGGKLSKRVEKRIKILREWSMENDFMEPKHKRGERWIKFEIEKERSYRSF